MKAYLKLYAKGFAMGAADLVPGVSGGTIAFISGIYDELLRSIASLPEAALLLLRGRVRQAWQLADGGFLLVLLLGILSSVFSLARLISYLLVEQPIPLWSFFFGLVLISAFIVNRDIAGWNWRTCVSFVLGLGFAWWITVASPVQFGAGPWSIFLGGAIAICAMILPGISGSFILLLLGLYPLVLAAVKSLDLAFLSIFAAGCLLGILSFSRLLHWLLGHQRNLTLSFLVGLMLGSLNKVWPWKQALSWQVDDQGRQLPVLQQNLLPGQFAEQVGDPQLLLALLMAFAGVALVVGLEWLSGNRQQQPAGND
jgi:putative membrane protein